MDAAAILYQSQHVLRQALDLLYPPHCAVCKRSGSVLCPSCLGTIRPLLPPLCWHCSSPSLVNGVCQHCRYRPLHLSGLRAVSIYQGPLRSCIHALKYNGATRLAEPLGMLLAQTYRRYDMQADLIVPVPLHAQRQRQRGYNHAHLLAQICAIQLGIPVRSDVLERHRATPAQVGLGSQERQQNVAGAFRCTPTFATEALRGRSIIIVDDVCTTGATLEACAASLFGVGVLSVWGLVLARSL